MHRSSSRIVFLTIVLGFALPLASGATQESTSGAASFLEHAAEGQESEIDLGQLAIEKAQDDQVKQFGARMVEDHQKARQEVSQLASKEGLHLVAQPSEQHKQLKAQLSKLSGQEFDRAYISTMLREHAKEMKELGQHSLMEKNKDVRQWAASALPVVKEHLDQAKTIASSLGIQAAQGH
jgi:putative membrane protein